MKEKFIISCKGSILAICSFALVLMLIPIQAFAKVTDDIIVDPNSGYTPTASQVSGVADIESSHISKIVLSSSNVKFDRTFNFNFVPQSCNGHAASSPDADMPKISTQSIQVTQANKISTSTDGSSSLYGVNKNLDFLSVGKSTQINTFSHAGEYVYLVTESSDAKTYWTDSKAEYTLRIYVANSDSGLSIDGVTVNRNIADDDTVVDDNDYTYSQEKVGKGIDAKVDPTNPNTPSSGDLWNEYAGWEYMSVFEPMSDLFISASANGVYADKSYSFNVNATLKAADYIKTYDKQEKFVGVIVDGNGKSCDLIDFEYGKASSFKLKSDYKLVFDGKQEYDGTVCSVLPAGVMYEYTQTGVSGYTNSTETKCSVVQDILTTTGTLTGNDLHLCYAKNSSVSDPQNVLASQAIIGQDAGNYSKIINAIEIVPTQVDSSTFPYVLALIVVACVIILFAYVFRKRNAKHCK